MIAALYSSRETGSKEFQYKGNPFGWRVIQDLYKRELARVKQNDMRRVPKLKRRYVWKDPWTRLNVLPAKIMQVCSRLSSNCY